MCAFGGCESFNENRPYDPQRRGATGSWAWAVPLHINRRNGCENDKKPGDMRRNNEPMKNPIKK